jgi:Ni/Co efflux regulator RcnB
MDRRIAGLLLFASVLATTPVIADPPAWAGGGKSKHQKVKQHDATDDRRIDVHIHVDRHFAQRDYVIVREYYQQEFSKGKCPPGLAKKRNGCIPPGQAKKWNVGHRLPRDVVWYELPPAIVIQLPPTRPGHQYVRVASDILLIAVGTGMVIDAIRDLGQM